MSNKKTRSEEYNLYLDETSRVSALDLYEDLLTVDDDKGTLLSVTEVNIEKKQLQEQNQLLLHQLSQATANLKSITEQNNSLKQNFACLLETAKTELERKNKVIARLSGASEPQLHNKPKSSQDREKSSTSLKGRRVDDFTANVRDGGKGKPEYIPSHRPQTALEAGESGLQLLPEKLVSTNKTRHSKDDRGSPHLKRKSIPHDVPEQKRSRDSHKSDKSMDKKKSTDRSSASHKDRGHRDRQHRSSSHSYDRSPIRDKKAKDKTSANRKEYTSRDDERQKSSSRDLRHKLRSQSKKASNDGSTKHSSNKMKNSRPIPEDKSMRKSEGKQDSTEPAVVRTKEPLKRKADSSTDVRRNQKREHHVQKGKTVVLEVPHKLSCVDKPKQAAQRQTVPTCRHEEVKTTEAKQNKEVPDRNDEVHGETKAQRRNNDVNPKLGNASICKADNAMVPDSITSTCDGPLFDMPNLDIYDQLDFNEDSLVSGLAESNSMGKSPSKDFKKHSASSFPLKLETFEPKRNTELQSIKKSPCVKVPTTNKNSTNEIPSPLKKCTRLLLTTKTLTAVEPNLLNVTKSSSAGKPPTLASTTESEVQQSETTETSDQRKQSSKSVTKLKQFVSSTALIRSRSCDNSIMQNQAMVHQKHRAQANAPIGQSVNLLETNFKPAVLDTEYSKTEKSSKHSSSELILEKGIITTQKTVLKSSSLASKNNSNDSTKSSDSCSNFEIYDNQKVKESLQGANHKKIENVFHNPPLEPLKVKPLVKSQNSEHTISPSLYEISSTIVSHPPEPKAVAKASAGGDTKGVGESFMHYYRNASLHCLLHLARKKLDKIMCSKKTQSHKQENQLDNSTKKEGTKSREVWLTSLKECQHRRKLRSRWLSEIEPEEKPSPQHEDIPALSTSSQPLIEPSTMSCNSWSTHEASINKFIGLADFAKILTPIKSLADESNSKGSSVDIHKLQQTCRNVFPFKP